VSFMTDPQMPSPPQRPSPREKKTVDVSTASEGCPARRPASPGVLALKILYRIPASRPTSKPIWDAAAVFGSVPRIRAPTPTAIRRHVLGLWIQSQKPTSRESFSIAGGHAYLTPPPGFFFAKDGRHAPGDLLRAAPFGSIAFANTDLSGVADHRSSITEANRAVGQLLDQVLS
jgi:hypothetical protein